jgi:pimeloyl-ACP methyl ester carboxylesterase
MARLAHVATARQAQLKDGRRLGFVEYGDPNGHPVMLFHDVWGNRDLRHPDDAILKQLGIRLIGMDRAGYGMSSRRHNRSLMDIVDDTMLLANALKLERFGVLGYSAGAPYALACAYRFPQVVSHCAVVASLPPMDDPQGFEAIHPMYARLFQLAQGMEPVFRLFMRGFFWMDSRRAPQHYIAERALSMAEVDRDIVKNPLVFKMLVDMWGDIRKSGSDGFVDEMVTLVKPWGFALQSVQPSVDIWWGEADTFCAPHVGKRMDALLPNSTLHLEPKAGHFIIFSHWQAILSRFVKSPREA